MSAVYCALVHHPVVDRTGSEVTTSVTNIDVHDIARSARTYGLAGYFILTPIEAQHPVIRKILEHWTEGSGRARTPERAEALSLVRIGASLEEAIAEIEGERGRRPRLVATSARGGGRRVSYQEEAATIRKEPRPTLLLFGTGHGLSPRVLRAVDVFLEPIQGPSDYNHLSVRSAAAITLDRLFGTGAASDRAI